MPKLMDMTADELTAFEAKLDKAATTPAGTLPAVLSDMPNGVPINRHISGAMAKSSQRFSITKALFHGIRNRSETAKFEMDALGRLNESIRKSGGAPAVGPESVWYPTNWEFLGDEVMQSDGAKYCKSVLEESAVDHDPEEEAWLVRKGVIYKAQSGQSAYNDQYGGTLVPPARMEPVIPLIRPMPALEAAGAASRPLPPQGRVSVPRITGAPSVQAVAESEDAPESLLSTDELVATAKKISGMTRIPKEATLFTSGQTDRWVQSELERSLALKEDAYGFYGIGGTSIPSGLTSSVYSSAVFNVDTTGSAATPVYRGLGANGNRLLPEYGDLIPAIIGEQSFGMDAGTGTWIMRPGAYASAVALRSDAVSASDKAGPKVDILRRFYEAGPSTWSGRRVVQTTNILGLSGSGTTKGASGANLQDVFFGIWSHCIRYKYGAISFETGSDGTTFKKGQYLIRGDLWGDIIFEYPKAFAWYPFVQSYGGLM